MTLFEIQLLAFRDSFADPVPKRPRIDFGGQKVISLSSQSDPLGSKSDPLGSKSAPLASKSDPLGSQSDPLASKSEPLLCKSYLQ